MADFKKGQKYRVISGLPIAFNDELTTKQGIYAQPGDIVCPEKDYPEMWKYPNRMQIWLNNGTIEPVQEPIITELKKTETTPDKEGNE